MGSFPVPIHMVKETYEQLSSEAGRYLYTCTSRESNSAKGHLHLPELSHFYSTHTNETSSGDKYGSRQICSFGKGWDLPTNTSSLVEEHRLESNSGLNSISQDVRRTLAIGSETLPNLIISFKSQSLSNTSLIMEKNG